MCSMYSRKRIPMLPTMCASSDRGMSVLVVGGDVCVLIIIMATNTCATIIHTHHTKEESCATLLNVQSMHCTVFIGWMCNG